MGMKSALIRTTGVLDAIGSSLGLIFKADVLIGFYLGALAAAGGTSLYMAYDQGPINDLNDYVDGALPVGYDGALMQFPDVCGLDDDVYLLSKKPGGGYEVSVGNGNYARVIPQDEQDDLVKEMSDCMQTINKWASKDNFEFTDEFKFAANVEHTQAGLVYDLNDETYTLYKDVSLEDDLETMQSVVKDLDAYDSKNDNIQLYRDQFAVAAAAWKSFEKNYAISERYFDSAGQIKDKASYARYDHDSATLVDKLTVTFGSAYLGLMFAGFMNNRGLGTGYRGRAEKRKEELEKLDILKGRDVPKF
ncbi:MAG: hypothetical protein CL561_03750 [Alphaproteobacteria bacterium]|nr:hypothetical protein [Alphaproteobacteria bacterium]|tara:strand:- start:529844 stop:530758 length:915 start_codon:yes stop_codon:yes gene_type:complete